jgi:excinuclease UvrABC nuclease subunit
MGTFTAHLTLAMSNLPSDRIRAEALRLLDLLANQPFEQCYPLSRDWADLPTRPGLYAVRHCEAGILYIGQSRNIRDRFRGGHKALSWALIDDLRSDDLGITVVILPYEWARLAADLEAVMLQTLKPRYNSYIPRSED